jgi:hypothetical protein
MGLAIGMTRCRRSDVGFDCELPFGINFRSNHIVSTGLWLVCEFFDVSAFLIGSVRGGRERIETAYLVETKKPSRAVVMLFLLNRQNVIGQRVAD